MKKKSYLLVVLLMLGVILIMAGCQQNTESQENSDNGANVSVSQGETAYPLTLTDDLGNQVSIDEEPQKIVSLSPGSTEILFAIGAGDKVVGRTDYCNYPQEALAVPSVGSFSTPNMELILELSPDIVISSDMIPDDVKAQIEATGAKVVVFGAVTIDGIMANIVSAGEMTNKNDAATALVEDMVMQRQEIMDRVSSVSEQKSVFIDLGDFYSAGPGSMIDSMLTDLNAKNIAAGASTPWPQLSLEQIIADNPDVYISFYTPIDEIKAVSGFDQLTVVKNDSIVYYEALSPESDMIQRPGPRIVEGLALLAKDIYPEVFTD